MVKQVIVIRKDLNMRKGKMIAQGAHASMKVFLDRGYLWESSACGFFGLKPKIGFEIPPKKLTPEMIEWIEGIFTKICVSVDSEKELLDVYNKAKTADLPCALIEDSGATEFKFTLCKICGDAIYAKGNTENCGYPLCECGDKAVEGEKKSKITKTCCAIGPAKAEDIDKITGDLKLL